MGFYDRIKFNPSGNPGTGSITVGAAMDGFRTPAGASMPNNNLGTYLATEGTAWEIFGPDSAYTSSGTSISRGTLIASSTGSRISFTSAAVVAMVPSAADVPYMISEDVASASTCNIGAAKSNYVNITGTTTITAFDTVPKGIWRVVKFAGALTLTHNATSLILPGGKNKATAAGDTAWVVSEGSGNWRCLFYQGASSSGLSWSLITTGQTAAAGSGYLCDTSGGAFTLTLPPSPAVGDEVAIEDVASYFHANNLTVGANGNKIMGLSEDMIINIQNFACRLIYSGSTNGWRIV